MVIGALLLPSLVLERHPAVWDWLASFRPGTFQAAEGALRASPHREREVVVLGSSVAVIDVIDPALAAMLDRPVLSAGVMAAPVCATAMFTPALEARRPETVLLVVGMRDLDRCRPNPGRLAFDPEIAWHAIGAWRLASDDTWLAAALGGASTLVRHRAAVRMIGHPAGPGWRLHPRYTGRIDDDGLAGQLDWHAPRLRDATLDGDGPSRRAFARMSARLRAIGAEAILVPAPLHPRLVASTGGGAGTSWHPAHLRRVAEIARDTGARHLGAAELGEYPPEDFADPTHLTASGQRRFTAALGRALR
ncbi:MAG: hypothetical protein KF729_03855 [Sandaracinaceae bacterium]|nr:hypothetical protein [Sandaracinaceae bacterium]